MGLCKSAKYKIVIENFLYAESTQISTALLAEACCSLSMCNSVGDQDQLSLSIPWGPQFQYTFTECAHDTDGFKIPSRCSSILFVIAHTLGTSPSLPLGIIGYNRLRMTEVVQEAKKEPSAIPSFFFFFLFSACRDK